MKTTAVTPADLAASVIAVPPLARHSDFTLNREANRTMIRYLEAGGVRAVLYGGNANFYNISVGEYAATLDFLASAADAKTWVIPSAGPDFGKLVDQAAILRERAFPTAMVLPLNFPATDAGAATGIRRFAELYGKPLIIYIKSENFLAPETIATLVKDGLVSAVKYGTVRANPADDAFLRALLDKVDRSIVVSGIGERPAIVHLRDFGVQGFTSGSVCLAPRASMKLLRLAKEKRWDEAEKIRDAFLPFEDCRDAFNPIRALHDAVTLAGIADMGPILPMLSNLPAAQQEKVKPAALALKNYDQGMS